MTLDQEVSPHFACRITGLFVFAYPCTTGIRSDAASLLKPFHLAVNLDLVDLMSKQSGQLQCYTVSLRVWTGKLFLTSLFGLR